MNFFVVGLIGGIGSGKSRVAAAFAARGGRVVSGDALGHEVLRQPEVLARVSARWGAAVLGADGQVDRRRMAARVFADPAELRELEAIVFPHIERRAGEEIARARDDPAAAFVVFDAAVMLEAGWDRLCDRLVFVDAPREVRLRRLAEQRGWDENELERRERAQLPLTLKAARAGHVIDNSGTEEHLARQVDELLRQWGVLTDASRQPGGAV